MSINTFVSLVISINTFGHIVVKMSNQCQHLVISVKIASASLDISLINLI